MGCAGAKQDCSFEHISAVSSAVRRITFIICTKSEAKRLFSDSYVEGLREGYRNRGGENLEDLLAVDVLAERSDDQTAAILEVLLVLLQHLR